MRKVKGKSFYKEPWYNSYRSMMDRCNNPNAHNYNDYGGRGIKVCEEWYDIENFEQWVKSSNYQKGLTIERIDVNGNYEPSNCTWKTKKGQANNRRNTTYVTIDGITKTISEWADFSGINRSTLNNRYFNGVRGVMLLHRVEDTKFKDGYNRYSNSKHYNDYHASAIIGADKEQEDTYKYLLHGAKSLVKDHPDLVRDIWNCSSCEHTEDECKDCYPELGYKNNKLRRDTEAVKEFVESDAFTKLMESFDEQDRATKEDAEQFLRDIKEQEE